MIFKVFNKNAILQQGGKDTTFHRFLKRFAM